MGNSGRSTNLGKTRKRRGERRRNKWTYDYDTIKSNKESIANIRKTCKRVWARQYRNPIERLAFLLEQPSNETQYVSIMWDINGERARVPKELIREDLGTCKRPSTTSPHSGNFTEMKAHHESGEFKIDEERENTQMVAADPVISVSAELNPSVFDQDTDDEANIEKPYVPSPVVSADIKTEPGYYDQDTDDDECLSDYRSAEDSAHSIQKKSSEHTQKYSSSVVALGDRYSKDISINGTGQLALVSSTRTQVCVL
eukprot:scaffold19295_cov36-Cyclotella_meneghiniana.AAC.2